jgi:hypothetical protein
MQHQDLNVSAKKPAELTGEIIDNAYALQLINGFNEKYPGEVSTILIESSTIFNAVKDLSNVSGIRFMYGMESANDPASKVLLLMPCNATSTRQLIPNVIVQPHGYLNNRGERVSLKSTWELLYNHAVHYAPLLPEVKFHKIVRGAFFGIDSLKALLQEYTNAPALHFHFGLDKTVADPALQHIPVLEPLHAGGTGYNLFMDRGEICPPPANCNDEGTTSTETCTVTEIVNTAHSQKAGTEDELNIYRQYRDNYLLENENNGPLAEMYYYVSPALKEAIKDTGRANEIYTALYNNEVRQCNMLIEEGKYEAAKILFEQTMAQLIKTYLVR